MEVSAVNFSQTASQIKLQKGQQEQEAEVISKLLASTEATAPKSPATGTGTSLNIVA